jgi:serine/threonine protein phosphatase PrpC
MFSGYFLRYVGDSRGVLCKNGELVVMTTDHKPNNESEILRINAANCEVTSEDVHMEGRNFQEIS